MAPLSWTSDELDRIGSAEELRISSLHRDDRLSKPRTIWVVRVGEGIYVRSVYGPASDWYRGTRLRREGHIQAGGVSKDIAMTDAGADVNASVDAAYRTKYNHYAAEIVSAITSETAASTTMRLDPR